MRRANRLVRRQMLRYLLRDDEEAAFTLMRACTPSLAKYIATLPGLNRADQEDLQQEVAVKFFAKLEALAGLGSKAISSPIGILGWLRTAAHHKYVSTLREIHAKKRFPVGGFACVYAPEVWFQVVSKASEGQTPAEIVMEAEEALEESGRQRKAAECLEVFKKEDPQRWSLMEKVFIKKRSVWKLAKRARQRARDLVMLLRQWCSQLLQRLLRSLGISRERASF
jgi:DNA-directed RNA polymerase specialized sigma24 family protein